MKVLKSKRRISWTIAMILSLAMIIASMPLTAFAAGPSTNLTFSTSATEVEVGDTFTVTLGVKGMTVQTFIGGVQYDNSIVECTKIEGCRDGVSGVYLQKSNNDYAELSAEKNATNSAVGFYMSGINDVSYKSQNFLKLTFRAKAAGAAGFSMYEDSNGTNGFNSGSTPISVGTTVTTISGSGTNPQASANLHASTSVTSGAVKVGDTFTVTLRNDAMKVSSFIGGINFDSNQVQIEDISGCRSGYDGFYLQKSNGDYTEITVAKANSGNAVGFHLINTNNANYKAGNFVKITFRAIKAGTIDMSLYEDTSGYDEFKADNMATGFSIVASAKSSSNLSARTSASSVKQDDEFTVTISTGNMRVSTLIGGITYDTDYVTLQSINGCRSGYNGVFLQKKNGDYIELMDSVISTGKGVGFLYAGALVSEYAAQDFIVLKFKAIKTGDTKMSIYEDSAGYDGYAGTQANAVSITISEKQGDSGEGGGGGSGGGGGGSGGGGGGGGGSSKSISRATIPQSGYSYTGNPIEPVVTVLDEEGNILTKDVDYKVVYKNNTEPGEATITISGIGDFEGPLQLELKFTIVKDNTIVVNLNKTDYEYTGKAILPDLAVMNADGKLLVKGTDYTIQSQNNTAVGTAKVIVTGIGKYKGTVEKSFNIVPKKIALSKVTAGKKKATAKWKKPSASVRKNITGYEIAYSTNKSFADDKTSVITKSTAVSKTFKKLTSKKYYYFKIRTYKKVGTETYYSSWSTAKKVKVK